MSCFRITPLRLVISRFNTKITSCHPRLPHLYDATHHTCRRHTIDAEQYCRQQEQQQASRKTAQNSKSKSSRPKRIILLRHGQSQGNVDEAAYVTCPDWKVPLTHLGRAQASSAGKEISQILADDERVLIYHSPYKRTCETMEAVCREIGKDRLISLREEPRISEQQFGNFQNVEEVRQAKSERNNFGRFYYRFSSGEAGLDVYSRVSSFISTLLRDCDQYNKAGYDLDSITVVIILHGLSLRLFLMRWFQFSVLEFERSKNPDNAQVIRMEKRCGGNHRWYEIDLDDRNRLNLPDHCGIPKKVDIHNLNS